MLRVCAIFHHLRFLQTTHLLFLMVLLLVLSVLILFAPMEHAKLEQIEFGATIHASFNVLEPVHIPFYRTITTRQCQSCKYRFFVLLYASHKRVKCFEMAGFHESEPAIKLFSCAFTHHLQKFLHEAVGCFNVRACLPQLSEALLLLFCQIVLLAEKKPGCLLC